MAGGGYMGMNLQYGTALVTGSGVRVGKALALALAREGVSVAVHYNRSAEPAQDTVRQINALGLQAQSFQADLADPAQAMQLVPQVIDKMGPLDILVNSAALFTRASLENTTEELWDREFAVNLKAPAFLSQAFAKSVGSDRSAHIINITDWRARHPGPNYLAYTLTKSGLWTLTQALALELAPNIQVNALALGAIMPPPGKGEEYFARLADEIPARKTGSPSDVAEAMVFLLRSGFITGEVIHITGGEHL